MKGNKLNDQALEIVKLLELRPHPEGGFYREMYRAPLVLSELPHGISRNAATAIYFLLPAGIISAFHRVSSDEVWHHYKGDSLALHIINSAGIYTKCLLGHDLRAGERPQAVVPANSWQAAEPLGNIFTLCGCTVSPGFDFADFELAKGYELAAKYPEHEAIIRRLSGPRDGLVIH
jgi:predicted cupin superfamily sugar epimerase